MYRLLYANRYAILAMAAFVVLMALGAHDAHAAQAAGGGLPWDQPFTTLKNDLTGPTPYAIGVIAGAVGLAGIMFGAQFGHAVEKVCLIVFILACIYGLAAGASIFLVSGATVLA